MQSTLPACSVDGCEKIVKSRGLCMNHYKRQGQDAKQGAAKRRPRTDSTTRDSLNRKRCIRCEGWFDTTSFNKQKSAMDGLRSYCFACDRERLMIAKYGINNAQLAAMIDSQAGKCALCERDLATYYAIDHDHACCPGSKTCGGCIRAILCQRCNVGLGMFVDDIELLTRAINYITEHRIE